jgi:hypothetical protein
MWAQMRDWLRGAVIDPDPDLMTDLTAPEYKFLGTSDRMTLESKESLKARGFASPDNADALACTFAVKVASQSLKTARKNGQKAKVARDLDFPLFSR